MQKLTIAAGLALAALTTPAFSSGVIHSANTEMGYTNHWDHAQPGRSRADVRAEIEQSKRDGSWNFLRIGAPVPVKASKPLTRAEVVSDLNRALAHPSWALRSRGAPVDMP